MEWKPRRVVSLRTFTVILGALFLTVSCAGDAHEGGVSFAFDPCEVIELAVDPGTTELELRSIDDALAMWASASALPLPNVHIAVRAAGGESDGALRIRFEDGAPFFNGQYDPATMSVIINRRITDPMARTITIAHELGHALGLLHATEGGAPSLMSPGNVTAVPTNADWQHIEAIWGTCGNTARVLPDLHQH